MAIILNDNIRINAGKPVNAKYLSSGNTAYTSVAAVNAAITIPERHIGLTVLINTGSSNTEYWYYAGVADVNLIEKKYASEQIVGDFLTGATNLGYFSGTTGIQSLTLSGFPITPTGFDGTYYSEYNWYYVDSGGVVRLGTATYGGALRRAYVTADRSRSWVWSSAQNQWMLTNTDVVANVGNPIILYNYSGSGYVQTAWLTGFQTNGSTSIVGAGSLTSGTPITIGEPIYKDKSNQELHLRSIINDTPDVMKIETDDYYIRFSGATSVINAANVGGGQQVFSQKTGTTLQFRTLVGSGDTQISTVGNEIRFFTSISGQTAITGGTNIGFTGGTGVFGGNDNKTMQFRNIIGSGDTDVSLSGDTIIIESSGGGVFTEDIVVSIAAGKTFGKYQNGDTIPASGKTAREVIILACFEAKDPTVNLNSSSNNVAFGESGKTVNLNFSYVINTLGASVASAVLEWRRGGSGVWSGLTTTTGTPSGFTHNIDDSSNRFNTAVLNYRYTVVDTEGMTGVTTHNVTPQAYQTPTISSSLGGTVTSPQTQTNREKGNVVSNPSGSINSNRPLVNITAWTLERRYNGGSWLVLTSGSSLSTLSVTIPSTLDNTIPTSVTSINYRITYVDEYTSGTGGAQTIGFGYFNYAGVNTNTSLSSAQIIALGNVAFATSAGKTYTYTTSPSEYAYYAYPATYSDVSTITMLDNGMGSPITITGAFQKLSPNVTVVNSYGESASYKVYRSNAPGAFSSDIVTFS